MSKARILVQLDPDRHASVFDAVVAVDAGVDQLLQYASVEPTSVQSLVHGAMFTRGPGDLKHTAIFIGGNQVSAAEQLLEQVRKTFFGPMRVSVMVDPNGANTTAAAAVLAAARHTPLKGATALVLAGTGPVGQRAARLLAGQGATVRVASRDLARAEQACTAIGERIGSDAILHAVATSSPESTGEALSGASIVIAAGAAGVELLNEATRQQATSLRVAIDLNAVPPVGIAGIGVMDTAKEDSGAVCYGAIGVGGTKMKIHKAALQALFTSNTLVLDAEEIFQLGWELEHPSG